MPEQNGTKPSGNRNVKDTVFRAIFMIKKYLLELYKALHPEDTSVSEDDLSLVTLENILAIREYNDLGFMVRDKLMILVEAQSSWSDNIVVRMMLYLMHEFHAYITRQKLNLFGSKLIRLPKPELFVIYTGERGDLPNDISLGETLWNDADCFDIRVRVIKGGNDHDIIDQYVRFARIFNEEARASRDDILGATKRTIKRCQELDVLSEFLADHQMEVENAMQLFTKEFMEAAIKEDHLREGRLSMLFDLVDQGRLTDVEASEAVSMPVADFRERMNEYDRAHA